MHRTRLSGQSFAEYALGIALVLLVAFGGLVALSGSINSGFLSILGSGSAQNPNGTPYHATATASVPNTANGTAAGQNMLASQSQTMSTQQTAVVQVAGSNGSENVQADSQKLMDLAAKYQDTDPAMANLIEQLAQQGFKLASALEQFDPATGNDPGQLVALDSQTNVGAQYESIWGQVQQSAEFGNLSAADQTLVNALATDTLAIGAKVADPVMQSIVQGSDTGTATTTTSAGSHTQTTNSNTAQKVNGNSQTIHTCSDGTCGN